MDWNFINVVSIKNDILHFYQTTRRHIPQDSVQIIINFYFSRTPFFLDFAQKTKFLSQVQQIFYFWNGDTLEEDGEMGTNRK